MSGGKGELVDPERVRATGRTVDLDLDPAAVIDLVTFGKLFLAWNARINLGGDILGDDLVGRHFLDAFAAARFVRAGDRVVDVGSGGGLPVIPLAIVRPDSRFQSHEPTAKKVAFLRTVVRELRLGDRLAVNASRLPEPPPPELTARFDVAISRATFNPARWLDLGRSLTRPGGCVLVFGTGQAPDGCPAPEEALDYAPNRRLLLFRTGISG